VCLVITIGQAGVKKLAEEASSPQTAGAPRADVFATTTNRSNSEAQIHPDGRECFFPVASHVQPTYEITLTGIISYDTGTGDGFYNTDKLGNFVVGHDALLVNGKRLSQIQHEMLEADRGSHRYRFQVDDPGERLTLAFLPASRVPLRGSLMAHVRMLPENLPTVAMRQARKREQEAKEREAAKISAAFAKLVTAVCIRSELFRNWEDPEYRSRFARVYPEELIACQKEIRDEASQFLEQQELVSYLRRHHPVVVERLMGRFNSLLIAERVVLENRLASIAPLPKKRLSAEEVRDLKLRRQQIKDGDKIALKLNRVETRLRIREQLDQYQLDTDERDQLERELIDEIDEGDDDHGTTL